MLQTQFPYPQYTAPLPPTHSSPTPNTQLPYPQYTAPLTPIHSWLSSLLSTERPERKCLQKIQTELCTLMAKCSTVANCGLLWLLLLLLLLLLLFSCCCCCCCCCCRRHCWCCWWKTGTCRHSLIINSITFSCFLQVSCNEFVFWIFPCIWMKMDVKIVRELHNLKREIKK